MRNFHFLISFMLLLAFSPTTNAQESLLGEVKLFAASFVPRNFMACDGQLLPINQHQALYSLLGTTYGGDGRTYFALPNLNGPTSTPKDNVNTEVKTSMLQSKSLQGGTKITVSFVNRTSHPVSTYWIDWQGKPIYYGDIDPGKTWSVNSGTKQLWRFTHSNKTISNIVLEEGKTRYGIESTPLYTNATGLPGQSLKYIICVNGIYPSRN